MHRSGKLRVLRTSRNTYSLDLPKRTVVKQLHSAHKAPFAFFATAAATLCLDPFTAENLVVNLWRLNTFEKL